MKRQDAIDIINRLDIYELCNIVIGEEEAHRFEFRDNLMFAMEKVKEHIAKQFLKQGTKGDKK
jgi:hypothetical protein